MDSSQRKKLVVVFILLAALLLIGFSRYRDKIFASNSSDAAGNQGDAAAASNVPSSFEAWRTPIPEVRWQKPEPVEQLKRDPMALDLSTVKVASVKPRTQTSGNAKDSSTIKLITLEGTVYHVNGIVINKDKDKDKKSLIIIEEQFLYEGDEIHGAKIIKILEHSVEFEKDGERLIVEIGEPTQKTDTVQK
jgi:hypothetical protein